MSAEQRAEYAPYPVNPDRAELERDFLGFTEGLRKGAIGVLPDLAERVDHAGRISYFDMPFGDKRLLLTPSTADEILNFGDGNSPDRIGFKFNRMMGIGKGNSHTVVSFGVASLDWFSGQGTSEQIPIAVKQAGKVVSRRNLLHEAAMYEYCARIGIDSLRVFGVAQYATKTALLTHFRPELTTLDNINWPTQTAENAELYIDAAIEGLVALHEKLIFHGDAEFKNIPFGQRRNQPLAVDFELAVSERSFADPKFIKRIAYAMANDLRGIKKSMVEADLLSEDRFERFEQFYQQVLIKYYAKISRDGGLYTSELTEAFDRVVNVFTLELEGKDTAKAYEGEEIAILM